MGRLSGNPPIWSAGSQLIQERATSAVTSACPLGTSRDSLLIFLAGTALFTCGLAPEFINLSARFALFAQEMLRNGPSFFPTTYRVPYPDYPAASTFLIYLVSLPFGRVTPFTALLPTAVASALILVLVYRIGAMHSQQWGLAAVLFALFTVEFFASSRRIAVDQYTSLATVLSFYLACSSDRLCRPRRLWLLPLVWAFGFAFRGPIGLVVPAAVSCVYYLWNVRFKPMLLVGVVAGGTLILCLGGLLFAARAQGGTPFMRRVLEAQMIGRLNDRGADFGYYWYRSLISYAVSYPLAIIVVASRFRDIAYKKDVQDRLLGALVLWVIVVLAGMSIPTVKKARYIMPLVPALSLIASYVMIEAAADGLLLRAKRTFLGLCAWLPIVAGLGVAGLLLFACFGQPEWCRFSLVTLICLIPLVPAARKLDRSWKDMVHRDMFLLAVGVITFVIVNVGIAEPILYSLERTKPFVRQVEKLCQRKPGTIIFFQVGPDAEDIKFMANLSAPLEPRFVSTLDAVDRMPGTRYIIAEEEVFRCLSVQEGRPMSVLVEGKIGHRDFVVFGRERPHDEDLNTVSCLETSVRG